MSSDTLRFTDLGLSTALQRGFEPTDPIPEPHALVAANGGGIKGKRPSNKDKLRATGLR